MLPNTNKSARNCWLEGDWIVMAASAEGSSLYALVAHNIGKHKWVCAKDESERPLAAKQMMS